MFMSMLNIDYASEAEIKEIAIVALHTSPNVALKEIDALDEVRKWVTKRYKHICIKYL